MEPSGSLLVLVKSHVSPVQLQVKSAVGGWLGGGLQVIPKSVWAVLPAVTATVRGFCPLTTQLLATSVSPTEWLPPVSALNVTLPLVAIGLVAPSTVTV